MISLSKQHWHKLLAASFLTSLDLWVNSKKVAMVFSIPEMQELLYFVFSLFLGCTVAKCYDNSYWI